METVFGGTHASINLKYFGEAGGSSSGNPLEYNLTMSGLITKARLRFGKSRWYGGLRYLYGKVEASPVVASDQSSTTPPDGLGRTNRLAGPALSLRYDSRDKILTPTKGFFYESNYSYFDPSFGGSINFERLDNVVIGYIPMGSRWTFGVRGDGEFSFKDPVFYARPYITLRGVPAMRYQRQNMTQVEIEVRWQFWKRISAVGFGGTAIAWK